MLTFYDIPSTIPGAAWSPNTWKIRYALNVKGIPYTTVWVEYPDIEETCKKIGAVAIEKRADGSPLYTFPVIHDASTGAVITESGLIAEYLEKNYPETPKLFPPGTKALQRAFLAAHHSNLGALWQLTMPATPAILNPPSQAYFKATKFGSGLKENILTGSEREEQFAKLKEGFSVLDSWLQETEGPFITGGSPVFVDLVVAGYILWTKKVLGEESGDWKKIQSWHAGRWDALLRNLEMYEIVA